MRLSAVILTNKRLDGFQPTLRSVAFADEVVLIGDSPAAAPRAGRKQTAYFHPLNGDFAAQRNFGLAKAKGDWVLFVDDDEIVSPALAAEIKRAVRDDSFAAYFLPRRDIYFGQTLKHGETGNMKIIRLAKKTAGKFSRPVHEIWQIKGPVGFLKNTLIHERGELVEPFIDRIARYGPLDARALDKEGKPFSYWRLLANPKAKFFLNYFIKLGFLDGYLGLFQAYLMSVQSLTVRVFQWTESLNI